VERGIKTMLGVPLLAGGTVIGVLHVGSLSGRPFSRQDTELLQLAADRAAFALHSLMAQDDALAAVALHRSLLPAMLPDVPGTGLAARYVTGTGNVGGDWYDVFTLPDGRLGTVVGDVAGSGLAAAVIMSRIRSALRAYVLETPDSGTMLRMLDRNIQYFDPDAMATVLYSLYTPGTGEFTFSSAGHLPRCSRPWTGARPGCCPSSPTADRDRRRPRAPVRDRRHPARRAPVLLHRRPRRTPRRGVDRGIGRVAATLDKLMAADAGHGDTPVPLAEDACAAVMRDLVGSAPARDDIALFVLHRHPAPSQPG
jgi:sigma-B regulation protein RsbU (phosphoserine phosphatase)